MFTRLIFVAALSCSNLIAKEINFNRDIRPILSDRCFHCHGPDKHDRKKDLRLDIAEGDDGAYRLRKKRYGIVPGDLEKSSVWQRIITDDEDDIMPPLDSHKKPLTDKEKALIKQWIEEGAKYEKFWAFELPKKSAAEKTKLDWGHTGIDKYVLVELERNNLEPKDKAEKRTLIRRLSFDLTGLPPTLSEVESFINDKDSQAYEKLVERFLAKSSYGEHMTRYWLDLVRAADTNGMHKDFYRSIYAYRDWLIRAFNTNLPYSDFLKYQLAGDLYEKPTEDQLIASGFNRLHLIIDKGTALPEESYTKNVIDRVTAVSTAFMGLTMQCARCHDHKFDAIKQKDFYAMFAFFNNIDGNPETIGGPKNGLQEPYITLGTDEEKKKLAGLKKAYNIVAPELNKLRRSVRKEKDAAKKTAMQNKIKELQKAEHQYNQHFHSLDAAMVMKESQKIKPSYMLNRGEYDQKGEVVERDIPVFFGSIKKKEGLTTRMDLANWFISKENPLTARVAVNRFWQQFFGVGLVKTSEDFGAQGETPSHPQLLDYLTVEFIESGWDVKQLMKKIVMSETYQQSSLANAEAYKVDPENRKLARGSRYRMDAEMIRDNILASSGLLKMQMYGKSVKPPQPDGLWAAVSMRNERFKPDAGDAMYRRSVYTYWRRGMPPPQMTIMNAPSREYCVARRERTNTPLQALLLLNEPEYLKAAANLAQSTLSRDLKNGEQRIAYAYEKITGKIPDKEELKALEVLITDLTKSYETDPQSTKEIAENLGFKKTSNKAETAAWTMAINSLYNLDITKNRE
jgi:hypothetical protein